VDDETRYASEDADIPAAARLLLYTDGLSEAGPKRRDRLFGTDGIGRIMSETSVDPLPRVLDHLFIAADRFAGPDGLTDDTTVIALERIA
jgi:serine phosphatase RsbU (regulator of sigma subunit)